MLGAGGWVWAPEKAGRQPMWAWPVRDKEPYIGIGGGGQRKQH